MNTTHRRTAIWTGKNSKEILALLEKIDDELILVFDGSRSKSGLGRACSAEGHRTGRVLKMVSWTAHVAVVRFVGVV